MNSRTTRRCGRLAVVATATALLTACSGLGKAPASSPTPAPDEGADGSTGSAAEVVAEGLDVPWSIAFADGTPILSERDTARILELSDTGEARVIATIEGVTPGGEGGLLGIAVHEDGLYAYSTAGEENRILRYAITGEPGSFALGPSETILSGIPAAGNHNGGRIAFGPDGMLYATAGDAGTPNNAQSLNSLGGKILRVTPEGAVPPDNPFPGSPVFSFGHRNPQGLAWADDGTLYASEFGQNTWDELNIIEPGANYGWPEVEGIAGRDGFVDPVQQWSPADASPSGIAIAGGAIHIANLRGERLRSVPLASLGDADERFVGEYGRLRDVVVAPDGSLWVLTNNTDGRGDPAPGDDRILRVDLGSNTEEAP